MSNNYFKQTHKCICAILVLYFLGVLGKIEDGYCVKVYYKQDDYYRIQCFRQHSNVLSITTDKNDVIEYLTSNFSTSCFNIKSRATKTTIFACTKIQNDECIIENEETGFWFGFTKDSNRIACKRVFGRKLYKGLEFKNLTVSVHMYFILDVPFKTHFIVYVPFKTPPRE
ncbi:unnamed protein product [Psylliodes chrysocephalus]|uniref:Uncharacterized protein n=1 Tax=Psylliodes chrysocephalus TaxID=3402493 RepID=A0A9P0GEE8_9CUCU|nr:unnamed protein product [Psylliodes chrysocephala]